MSPLDYLKIYKYIYIYTNNCVYEKKNRKANGNVTIKYVLMMRFWNCTLKEW